MTLSYDWHKEYILEKHLIEKTNYKVEYSERINYYQKSWTGSLASG